VNGEAEDLEGEGDEGADEGEGAGGEDEDAEEDEEPEPPAKEVKRKPEPYEVPKSGHFFMHDDRTEVKEKGEGEEEQPRRTPKKLWSDEPRWKHDKYLEVCVGGLCDYLACTRACKSASLLSVCHPRVRVVFCNALNYYYILYYYCYYIYAYYAVLCTVLSCGLVSCSDVCLCVYTVTCACMDPHITSTVARGIEEVMPLVLYYAHACALPCTRITTRHQGGSVSEAVVHAVSCCVRDVRVS
jgi:hypothetical protein